MAGDDDSFDGPDYKLVWTRINKWQTYRSKIDEPKRYLQLKRDLWVVRNPEQAEHEYNLLPMT